MGETAIRTTITEQHDFYLQPLYHPAIAVRPEFSFDISTKICISPKYHPQHSQLSHDTGGIFYLHPPNTRWQHSGCASSAPMLYILEAIPLIPLQFRYGIAAYGCLILIILLQLYDTID